MANRILQLFRNETFYTDRTAAKTGLENRLKASSEDGVPMIARYEDNGKVKTILGISASGDNFTIWDPEAIPADVQTELSAITGGGDVSFVDAINNAIQSLDVTDDAVSGKVVKAVSEADGKISVSRDFLVDADIKVEKMTTSLGETVKEAYKLVNGNNEQLGAVIEIYKDQTLKEIKLVSEWSEKDGKTVPADTEGATTKTGQGLQYTYYIANGNEETVTVDVSTFLIQSEFKNGFEVSDNGEVSIKIATGENMLQCDENGLALSDTWDCGTW